MQKEHTNLFGEGEKGRGMVLAVGNTMENCIPVRPLLLEPNQNLPESTEIIHTNYC